MLIQFIPLCEGALLTLADGGNILGRSEECSIRIAHDTVSDKHCSVQCAGSTVIVRDLGSMNSTLVNGRKIQRVALSDGDEIQFGQLVYRVRISSALVSSKPDDDALTVSSELEKPASLNKAKLKTVEPPEKVEQPIVEFTTAQNRTVNRLNQPAVTSPREPGRLAEWIREKRTLLIVLIVCGGIVSGIYGVPWSTLGETPDRTFFTFYFSMLKDLDELIARNAPEGDWKDLKTRSFSKHDAFVRELTKSASSRRLARQILLFAARDHLPRVFSVPPSQRVSALSKLRNSLHEVQQILDDPAGYLAALQNRLSSQEGLLEPNTLRSPPNRENAN